MEAALTFLTVALLLVPHFLLCRIPIDNCGFSEFPYRCFASALDTARWHSGNIRSSNSHQLRPNEARAHYYRYFEEPEQKISRYVQGATESAPPASVRSLRISDRRPEARSCRLSGSFRAIFGRTGRGADRANTASAFGFSSAPARLA